MLDHRFCFFPSCFVFSLSTETPRLHSCIFVSEELGLRPGASVSLRLRVYGYSDHPLPICCVWKYFRIGNGDRRTMIDDEPPSSLHSVTTALAATHGAAPGPEEEMRGSLEDTDTIRSLQVSRLLFISRSFSLSLFCFFCFLFCFLCFPACVWQWRQNRCQSAEE